MPLPAEHEKQQFKTQTLSRKAVTTYVYTYIWLFLVGAATLRHFFKGSCVKIGIPFSCILIVSIHIYIFGSFLVFFMIWLLLRVPVLESLPTSKCMILPL